MGIIKQHLPVKVFTAIAFGADCPHEEALIQLGAFLGPVILKTKIFLQSAYTDYYESEMGPEVKKYFAAFEPLMAVEELAELKIKTNALERKFAKNGRRRINIDPGYLTEAKVVLATTKDYSHRLYLGKGIFGDLHLTYSRKTFRPQPWTYPDYRQELALEFFNRLRNIYKEDANQIKKKT